MIPMISILVPAYNAERHIEACLRSILDQMEAHHTLTVVDDGSLDDTAQVVERLRQAHPAAAFTLIRQANQGIALTRNRLLEAATGEYIQFVDADDLLLPGTLAALEEVIAAHRPDVIACDFNDWHPHNMRRTHRVTLSYPANVVTRDREEILRAFFMDLQSYVWAHVMRREIYARQPAPLFPPGRKFEDVTVLAQLLADCSSLYHLVRPTIDYRQHRGSLKRSVSHRWCTDFASAVLHIRQHFDLLPISDSLRMNIDVTAVHIYIVILKSSYELPWNEGRAARADVRALLARSLFHDLETVLAAMEAGTVPSIKPDADRKAAAQMRKMLRGSMGFVMTKLISRKIKALQRMATA